MLLVMLTAITTLVLNADKWDCVATCYFMDTAHNIIAYLENIYAILKPGGYWVNFGKCNCFLYSHYTGCDCEATT